MNNTFNRAGIYFGLVVLICLSVFPFVNDSRSLLILFTQIFIFAIFAMSFDILLGYTGIVSFGHCMFFGIGAYCVALLLDRQEVSIASFLIGIGIAVVLSAIISYIIGMLSLRLKSHFYAMLTLAISQLLFVLAEKWRSFTHGGDGFTFRVPDMFRDRFTFYYITLICLVVIFLLLRVFTQSSIGKVLKAISQNEQRVEALGYKIIHYKIIASIVAGVVAALSGGLFVITLRFVNTTVFSIEMTLNALLMTMIGGVGTLVGAIAGAGMIESLKYYLSELATQYPIFERWTIFLGLLYIIVLLGFPTGLTGTVKKIRSITKKKGAEKSKEVEHST
ncbi:branched-chain amino acid ABC transporter permease [Bacillus pseudomycoides]|uniref:Branched-chain amino acid ABC transporter permease n=1 Tax=Bacillus pseudomycoides TaxID=64104 RepID=A0A2A8C1V6_9BACI|nr:branched-chain amino acid ABC transporter permease [Bacillus pseudomycoides]PDY45487.1 branched-chain amino acid ABC transporter permease [Bacillus pseudomycoides]PED72469.1 branched-chain amino acid ABC transporter permease [Bacillus pseudomycoides]PEI41874.1 branched-chain amino acid ABC transporter permease [Bacillus pseudomycoides]PEJ81972.1 branched-chain amino acid ABC transporter permease [Bacillus pseudomycoides]PEM12477.1 branched-chain amino acid ABC transporter permease [Bacillus